MRKTVFILTLVLTLGLSYGINSSRTEIGKSPSTELQFINSQNVFTKSKISISDIADRSLSDSETSDVCAEIGVYVFIAAQGAGLPFDTVLQAPFAAMIACIYLIILSIILGG